MDDRAFTSLSDYLIKVPAITDAIAKDAEEDDRWRAKSEIDINHQFAWQTAQELGHVLNYLSTEERLPTHFHPVSPLPYMNGGPEEFLSWVIECHNPEFRSGTCAKWLLEMLPNPVDLSQWKNE